MVKNLFNGFFWGGVGTVGERIGHLPVNGDVEMRRGHKGEETGDDVEAE